MTKLVGTSGAGAESVAGNVAPWPSLDGEGRAWVVGLQ